MAIPSDNATFLDKMTRRGRCCVGRGIASPEEGQIADTVPIDTAGGRVRRRLFGRFDMLRSTAFRIAILFWLLFQDQHLTGTPRTHRQRHASSQY